MILQTNYENFDCSLHFLTWSATEKASGLWYCYCYNLPSLYRMNLHSSSSKHDELREHIFDYSNYSSTEDENSNWKRSTSDASFFLDGQLPIDEW